MVLIDTDTDITQYLTQQRAHNNLPTVIRDNDYTPFRVFKGIMTPLATLPLKTTTFRYLS
jgi:hypothetical protein